MVFIYRAGLLASNEGEIIDPDVELLTWGDFEHEGVQFGGSDGPWTRIAPVRRLLEGGEHELKRLPTLRRVHIATKMVPTFGAHPHFWMRVHVRDFKTHVGRGVRAHFCPETDAGVFGRVVPRHGRKIRAKLRA